jgi:c-di-GMP-binding flagellar brake protein YcgR
MTDHYQLVTVNNTQQDSLAIVAKLQAIQAGQLVNDLRLLNYYNEIPVSYPASVDYVEGDMVDLTVHQNQAVVMKFERKTIIKSQHFQHEVIANVFRANINTSLVTLTNFAYVLVRAERRRFVRVALKDSLEASFADGEKELRGRLVDISLCGAAILAGDANLFDTQAEGALLLTLCGRTISVSARLIKLVQVSGETKYVFDFEVSGKDEALVSQFIFQRQVEIIRELKDQV